MTSRVLVVIADPVRAGALRHALIVGGAKVECAENVDTALELVERVEIDALVVDLHLPRTSAIVLVQRLRERANGRRVFAVALTRIDTPDVRRVARDHGFDACMSEKASINEIARVVFQGAVP